MRLFAVAVLLVAWPAAAGADDDAKSFNPQRVVSADGKELRTPLEKPVADKSTSIIHNGLVVKEPLPTYASPDDDSPLKFPAVAEPKFGDILNIMAEANGRLLLARFAREGGLDVFKSYVGWVPRDAILDAQAPLTVRGARLMLDRKLPEKHRHFGRAKQMLPAEATEKRFERIVLKAVTHPDATKTLHAFSLPVPPKETEARTKDAIRNQLTRFSFYCVQDFQVTADNVYCLLTLGPDMPILNHQNSGKAKDHVVGWVELDNLVLWTSREGFEPNHDPAAVAERAAVERANAGRAEKDKLVFAAYDSRLPAPDSDQITPDPIGPDWKTPLGPGRMRYFALRDYPYPQKGLPNGKGFQICIPYAAGGKGTEDARGGVSDAIQKHRVLELVIVIDRTGSMFESFPVVRNALAELVEKLAKKVTDFGAPELERIDLRVAVVGYSDFTEADWTAAKVPGKYNRASKSLIQSSGRFFKVTTDKNDRQACLDYIGGLTVDHGGDIPEEPYEGVRAAVQTFLAMPKMFRPTHHSPGAATLVVLIGDAGNHVKGTDPLTRLDVDDVTELLTPIADGAQRNARTPVHTVFVQHIRSPADKKAWEHMIEPLANRTGGTKSTLVMTDDAQRKVELGAVADALGDAIERRRRDVASAVQSYYPKGGAKTMAEKYAEMLRKEIISDVDYQRLLAGAEAVPAFVHVTDRLPGEKHERLSTRVLLSRREVDNILQTCRTLETELQRAQGVADGAKLQQNQYKELIVSTLLTAFGAPAENKKEFDALVAKMKGLTLKEIEEQVSSLPVQFGVLQDLQPNQEAIDNTMRQLQSVIQNLETIQDRSGPNGDRWFEPVPGVSSKHVWVRPRKVTEPGAKFELDKLAELP